MSAHLCRDELVAVLRDVVDGRHSGKPLFPWQGGVQELRSALDSDPRLAATTAWLDVNQLAEDVIPRRARERLAVALQGRLEDAIAASRQILVVKNPYLLLRYEPSAPLALFWNRFVSSSRAVIVIVPRPVSRPADLPPYVPFRADNPQQLFGDAVVSSPATPLAGGEQL